MRPDLSNKSITLLAALLIAAFVCALLLPGLPAPGSGAGQLLGAIGGVALCAPLVFFIMKRSGTADSPPLWFVIHVLCSVLGVGFIVLHTAQGYWFSPPGALLLLLVVLTGQGLLMRGVVAPRMARLFARGSARGGFAAQRSDVDKAAIGTLIERKQTLLARLDPGADEALFSPHLRHWLRYPSLTCRYVTLARREADLVGARAAAGWLLNWSRRLHMTLAALFLAGLIVHVVLVLFFAGYVAGEGDITWWYLADWGR